MKSLIAGPTDMSKIKRFWGMDVNEYSSHLEELARTSLKTIDTINIIPDRGVPLDFAKFFRNLGGNVVGYVPKKGSLVLKENFKYCNEVVELDSGWSVLNTCLSLNGDLIIALGLSPGTIVEIAYTKYHHKYLNKEVPILIDSQTLRSRLPEEISEELDISYFSNSTELNDLLNKIKKELK